MGIVNLAVVNTESALHEALRSDVYNMDVPTPSPVLLDIFTTRNSETPPIPGASPVPDSPESSPITTVPAFVRTSPAVSPYDACPPAMPSGFQVTSMATGETITITMESAGRYRLELKLDGLIEWGHVNRTSFVFLTTTFSPDLGMTVDERVECRNDFIHELRRVFRDAGLPLKYVWVYSLQLDRYLSGA